MPGGALALLRPLDFARIAVIRAGYCASGVAERVTGPRARDRPNAGASDKTDQTTEGSANTGVAVSAVLNIFIQLLLSLQLSQSVPYVLDSIFGDAVVWQGRLARRRTVGGAELAEWPKNVLISRPVIQKSSGNRSQFRRGQFSHDALLSFSLHV
jgi:hypothetical protein